MSGSPRETTTWPLVRAAGVTDVIPERTAAETDGGSVVFRIDALRKVHRWLPTLLATPRTLRELDADPDGGLPGHQTHLVRAGEHETVHVGVAPAERGRGRVARSTPLTEREPRRVTMAPTPDRPVADADTDAALGTVACEACRDRLRSAGRGAVAFLLLDHLRVPIVGCDDHRERFASVCGLTSTEGAELLTHRPAGGLACPGCRNAPRRASQPVLPVDDGVVAVVACARHREAVVGRYEAGLEARSALFDGPTDRG